MFSVKPLTEESFHVAIIKNKATEKVLKTIWYTESSREFNKQDTPFEEQIDDFIKSRNTVKMKNCLQLKDEYIFELLPNIGGKANPRLALYVLAPSNSGKSYAISRLLRRYNQLFPENLIAYCSANPIAADTNYDIIKDKIKSVDVLNLTTTIDFTDPTYFSSCFVYDDTDSGFSCDITDLHKSLTMDEVNNMTVVEKQKMVRILKQKCEAATLWIEKSVISMLNNGRKNNISVIYTAHKMFDGQFANKVIAESTGLLTFPTGIKKNILQKFLIDKLSMDKNDAKSIVYDLDWYRYDFLYISHRTSKQFIITPDVIKLLDE